MPGGRWSWGVISICPAKETYYRVGEVRTFNNERWVEGFVEWRPRKDLTVRTELANWTSRSNNRTRVIYAGSRASGTVNQVETRDIPFEPYLFIKVRKSFG
jgi:hypothetical protein